MSGAAIVAAARRMKGTPFHHQGRVPGEGLDCVGMLASVGRSLGLRVVDDTSYPPETDQATLEACLEASCEPLSGLEEAAPGDILVFLRGRTQWHTGIMTKKDPLTMVHAWSRYTGGSVREEALGEEWLGRLRGVWRYLEDPDETDRALREQTRRVP